MVEYVSPDRNASVDHVFDYLKRASEAAEEDFVNILVGKAFKTKYVPNRFSVLILFNCNSSLI